MDKVKELPKVKDNGKKEKMSRNEMIHQVEQELEQLKIAFHQKTGYLAGLKQTD